MVGIKIRPVFFFTTPEGIFKLRFNGRKVGKSEEKVLVEMLSFSYHLLLCFFQLWTTLNTR